MIGKEINPALVKRLREKTMRLIPMGGPMAMLRRRRATASLQGDYDTLLGFRQALDELDIDVDNMICSHSLKAIEIPDPAVRFCGSELERIDLFSSLAAQWCLGSEEMERCCRDKNAFTLISAPFVSRAQAATHLPFMGEKGMDYLVELKDAFFSEFGF